MRKLQSVPLHHYRRCIGIVAVALTLLSTALSAQTSNVHLFQAAADVDHAMLKMMLHEVRRIDPAAHISVDGRSVKVKAAADVSGTQLLAALNSHGAACTGSERDQDSSTGMPIRVDTGDPAADDARYAAAKQTWIDAHPEAYEKLLRGEGALAPITKSP